MDEKIATAKEEGAKEENARIKGIEAISVPGADAVVKEHKFDMTKNADAISGLILQSQKEQMDKMAEGLDKDGNKLAELSSGLGTGTPAGQDNQDDQELVAAMVGGMNGYTDR
jgi:hypothetical protein